jgi:Na+-transporting NADH:ubiquinone oxidoreductase subunit NqrB
MKDPRYYQMGILSPLFAYGLVHFDFGMPWKMALITLASVLVSQVLFTRLVKLPKLDLRSPLISGLSLCLLLRTNDWWLAVLAGILTIGSKFFIRHQGSHVFNPTNFGIVVLLLITDRVWISPGQWGSGVLLAFLFACAGMMVIYRAARSDVTWAFIGAFSLLIFSRALYLGDPWSIPLRQLQSGALLLFAFFMISDPKTTPQSRAGRIVFAGLVALIGVGLQFNWYNPISNGIFYALTACSLTVPVINRLLPGERYEWTTQTKKNYETPTVGSLPHTT